MSFVSALLKHGNADIKTGGTPNMDISYEYITKSLESPIESEYKGS